MSSAEQIEVISRPAARVRLRLNSSTTTAAKSMPGSSACARQSRKPWSASFSCHLRTAVLDTPQSIILATMIKQNSLHAAAPVEPCLLLR